MNCPLCGSKPTYIGATSLECSSPHCANNPNKVEPGAVIFTLPDDYARDAHWDAVGKSLQVYNNDEPKDFAQYVINRMRQDNERILKRFLADCVGE